MIDRRELAALTIDGADPRLIVGTVQILAARNPSRHYLEKIVSASVLPFYTDFVVRTVVAYPWRMGVERCADNLLLTARILVCDPDGAVLPRAVVAYADAIDEDERRRGSKCRLYVPHMETWLNGGAWRHIANSRSRMGATEDAYERIKRARGG